MDENKGIITVETAAKLIMKTPRHVQRLVADGWIKKTDDGQYTLISVVQGYIRWRDDSERRRSQTAARAGADDVRTKLLQLRLDTESKKLIPLTDAMETLSFVVGCLKSEFVGFPAAVTRDRLQRLRLKEAIDAVFTRAVGRIETERGRIASGG